MSEMNAWDVALLVAAGYVAATALVRLMIRRRDQMLGEFRKRMRTEKRRKEVEAEQQVLSRRRGEAA